MLFNIGPTLFEFALVIGILLVKYSWPFAFVTFVTIVAYAVFTFVASEWRIGIRREMNERDNEVSAQSVDSLLNYETVKTFTNEGFERDRLDRTLALYQSAAIRSQTSLAALNFGQAGIIAVGVTVIMILAARGVVAGTMTVGDVVLVNTFLLQLYQPLNFLGVVYRQVRQSLTDLENLMGLLDLEPEVKDRPGARPLALDGAAVRFEAVSFGYDPRRPVLREVDFAIPAGHTLALVGQVGRRQVHGRAPAVPLLRRRRGRDPDRRPGPARRHSGVPARRDRPGAAGHRAVQRHHPGQHRLRPPRRRAGGDRGGGARARRSTTSSRRCRTATRPWSASAASSCPAARSSGSRSRAWC